MKAGQELPFERAERHSAEGSQLPIGDRAAVVVPHMRERRFESRDLCAWKFLFIRRAGDAGGADNRALRIKYRYFICNAPGCDPFGLAYALNSINNTVTGQYLLIIKTEMISYEFRR